MKCIRHSVCLFSLRYLQPDWKRDNQVVIHCLISILYQVVIHSDTYSAKKLHRSQQGTEILDQEYWGKAILLKRLVYCNKQQIHIATTLPKCLQLRSCPDTHRNEEGRLLDRRPAACRTSPTWKRLTTETKRCHNSDRNQELQNLACGKKKYAECQVKKQIYSGREWHWSYPEVQILSKEYQQIQNSFCKNVSSMMCIQRNKYQIRMLTRPSLTRQHEVNKCGKCSIYSCAATEQSHSLLGPESQHHYRKMEITEASCSYHY